MNSVNMESGESEFRIKALSQFLVEDIEDISDEGDNLFSVGRREYMVLTDDEADEEAKEYIEQSLWAFNADFLCGQMGLPFEAVEMISGFCEAKCEGANDTILAMLSDSGWHGSGLDDLVHAAISADGRGHFINSYDGNEDEEVVDIGDDETETYYIYRMN